MKTTRMTRVVKLRRVAQSLVLTVTDLAADLGWKEGDFIEVTLGPSGEVIATPEGSHSPLAPALQLRLNRGVEDLELSVRSYNCLRNANIRTVGELVARTEAQLLKSKNFGSRSLWEIENLLAHMGLRLKGSTNPVRGDVP